MKTTDTTLLVRILAVVVAVVPSGCGRSSPPPEASLPADTTPVKSQAGQADSEAGWTDGVAEADRSAVATTVRAAERTKIVGSVPNFSLIDQNGQAFGLDRLKGRVWVVNFFFTRCTATCPAQTTNMAKFQTFLGNNEHLNGVRLVSISVDPENDPPDVLQRYAEQYNSDTRTWTFLTGDREQIWKLSKDGFHLPVAEDARNSSMPIMHDSKVALVDRVGRIRGYFDGMTYEGFRSLADAVAFIAHEIVPPNDAPDLFPDSQEVTHYASPTSVTEVDWMETRKQEQLASRERFDVFHDFRFSDKLTESGITFVPQIVDEQRSRLQINHFDHAYGVSIADVDNDGRYDIYFLTQVGGNELWRNLGQGRFENITQQAGVAVADRISVSGVFADTDNDGDADLYVTTVRGGNLLFENDGAGSFQDISELSGLGYVGHSSTPVFFDYDCDGLLDVFLTNVGRYTTDEYVRVRLDRTNVVPDGDYMYYTGIKDAFAGHLKSDLAEASILFKNTGNNRFVDVSQQVGLNDTSWSGDATPFDANGDGWPDLYVLNMQGQDEFYENVQGERFVKTSREVFPRTPWGAMGVKVFDFDNDGNLDLYVTDMHSDMSADIGPEKEKLKSDMQWPESFLRSGDQSIFGNALYLSDGSGGFREVSDSVGAENYWPWGLSVGDLNADGFDDALVTSSMCTPYRYGVNSVLLNNRGREFLDSEFILGVEPRVGGKIITPWCEFDASGRDSKLPMCVGRSGIVLLWSSVGTRSGVIFDLDHDGDLDIVTNDFNTSPMVLISDLSEKNPQLRFLKVRLTGTQSNRDGLGSIVRVVAGDETYTKVYDGKSGYLSQSLYPLYFGLGTAESVDRIEVDWPSGQSQTVGGPIDVNTLVEVTEPGG